MDTKDSIMIAVAIILFAAFGIAFSQTSIFFLEENESVFNRLKTYEPIITPLRGAFIIAWFSVWGAIFALFWSDRRKVGKLAITSVLGFAIFISGYYLGIKALKTIGSGNDAIEVPYYLPIQNPYDRNETVSLIVVQNTSSFIAQESYITTYVELRVNETYRHDNKIPLLKQPPENFTIVFEGTSCYDSYDNPNHNYEIGFACTILLNHTSVTRYNGAEDPLYVSEGSYGLFLATNKTDNAEFTNTKDFINIRSVESLRQLELEKLGVYSTVIGIGVATAAAIIVLMWTGREFGFNKSNPQDSNKSNHGHSDQKPSK